MAGRQVCLSLGKITKPRSKLRIRIKPSRFDVKSFAESRPGLGSTIGRRNPCVATAGLPRRDSSSQNGSARQLSESQC